MIRKLSQLTTYFRGSPSALPPRNLDWNAADCSGNLGRHDLIQELVSSVPVKQKDPPASGGPAEIGPPDFVLSQAFHSSAEDQSSASAAESGCRRYASRMSSYSCLRIASFTARRINSARCRFAAGAILFRDLRVDSSIRIHRDGMWLLQYYSTISTPLLQSNCN
jgi:hypothetical protein